MYKQVIKKFKRRKVYVSFKNDICATYFAQIRSLPSSNRVVTYLLCATDIFTKYARVQPLKDEKAKTVPHGFNQLVNEFKL